MSQPPRGAGSGSAPIKRIKRRAIRRLHIGVSPDTPEEKLWFAVLGQAVLDIGLKDKVHKYRRDYWNADSFFRKGGLSGLEKLCDFIDSDVDYVLKILYEEKVLPVSPDHYTE